MKILRIASQPWKLCASKFGCIQYVCTVHNVPWSKFLKPLLSMYNNINISVLLLARYVACQFIGQESDIII